jgi:hypothetical protein
MTVPPPPFPAIFYLFFYQTRGGGVVTKPTQPINHWIRINTMNSENRTFMRRYMEDMERYAAENRREHEGNQLRTAAEKAIQLAVRTTPLIERVKPIVDAMTPEQLAAGIELQELRMQLQGRCHGNAHPGELGQALRELGFNRRRAWNKSDQGFRSRWYRNDPT